MRILAIETSCDDTAVAIVEEGRKVLVSLIYSQTELHRKYGGVVPESAARQHIETINFCLEEALLQAGLVWAEIDLFAATLGPGLVGSLLIGANTAKTLSLVTGKPFRGVNHLHAHVASNYLESDLEPPFLCLLVSGGHTQLLHVEKADQIHLIGETLDDAVGEAYDKIARLMQLPYPGGPALDQLAPKGNPKAYRLPKAKISKPFDFSFSGLKTATLRAYEKALEDSAAEPQQQKTQQIVADIAASFQHTVIETLFEKTVACAESLNLNTIAIAGGVSANQGLRNRFMTLQPRYRISVPPMCYCTDNAAMVGAAAFFNPLTDDRTLEVFSRQPACLIKAEPR